LGGGQAGCDYQFAGNWVIGIQGDYAWTDATGSHFDVVDGTTDRTRIRSLSTVTGRIGYAWDRFLGYVKGGGAWERDNYDRLLLPANTFFAAASETRGGWTVGVGGEYAFTNYLTGFVEYNYYDFGNRTLTFFDVVGGFDNINIRERKSVIRGGLNFRWGYGPVIAKY
jgi:outer membrane immunogenic protein